VVVSGRSLRIEADLDRLADVRRFVREVATGAGANVDCLEDLVQAVDEAVTNVIVHGYRRGPGWVEISAEVDGPELVVTLEDAAPPFDPTTHPEPDLSVAPMARRPGGMGVHLIREATDRLTYRPRPGGGNILTLRRALHRAQKEAG
jgi:serine/threonine-protein kinase RsbW